MGEGRVEAGRAPYKTTVITQGTGDDSLNQGVAVKMASGWPLDIFCNYMCICLSFLWD